MELAPFITHGLELFSLAFLIAVLGIAVAFVIYASIIIISTLIGDPDREIDHG